MRKQELSLVVNGIMILAVISVFFILIFFSSRLRKENLETLYGLHGMYVRINSGDIDTNLEKEELSRLLDGSFPGDIGERLQEQKDRIIRVLETGEAEDDETRSTVNHLIGLYKTILQYRDEVLDAFFYFLILAIGLQSLIFTISLKRVFSFRQGMAERENYLLKLQDMQEQERQDLAANLHDNVLQDMGALNLILTDEKQRSILQECMNRIRKVNYSLVPVHLDSLSLDRVLEELGNQLFTGSSCHLTVRHFGYKDEYISSEIKRLLYRIAREALSNVYKHSGASRAELTLTRLVDKIILIVEDNGRGFLVEESSLADDKGGLGLFMLSILAERMGAEILIDSSPGEGCRIKTVYYIKGGVVE